MKKISHKNRQNAGTEQVHVDSTPIPPIKRNNDDKLDEDFFKIKLSRDPKSEKLDLFEFKMELFDKGDPEEFLFFYLEFQHTY